MSFNFFLSHPDAIIAVANIILIVLIYMQLRDSRKPIITTKIISRGKELGEVPNVLEYGDLYLVVRNISRNVAKNIKIEYEFLFDNKKVKLKETLSYLNPDEATKFIIKSGKLIEKYPELFEEFEKGTSSKKIPKETLKILLNIKITYNPIIFYLLPYETRDSYEIEWCSLKSCPRFEDHPVFNCWNKRDRHYIYKLS